MGESYAMKLNSGTQGYVGSAAIEFNCIALARSQDGTRTITKSRPLSTAGGTLDGTHWSTRRNLDIAKRAGTGQALP